MLTLTGGTHTPFSIACDSRTRPFHRPTKSGLFVGNRVLSDEGLVVLPTDVANAADRWVAFRRAVRSRPVVVVEPVWQRLSVVLGAGVDEAVDPFALEGLDEALDFAVGARPVGLGRQVADLSLFRPWRRRAPRRIRGGSGRRRARARRRSRACLASCRRNSSGRR
jgi:hypothetical protein